MDLSLVVLIVGWIFVLIWVPIVIASNRKTHPKALFVLFFAEMWERFSYYGMRAILVLYMTQVLFSELAQGEGDERALGIYGAYTSMVYLFPVIGGLIADRIFGFRKAILLGGTLMMIGHFTLALEGMLFPGSLPLFFLSLSLIIIGNGYFKPNISSFLGTFYSKDDPRKDGAFTIFYMGVNIGAFLATLTCGYVGQQVNWHYGFGLAGIGMALGLIVFYFNQHVFGQKGKEPDPEAVRRPALLGLSQNNIVFLGTLLAIPITAAFLNINDILSFLLIAIGIGIMGYFVVYAFQLMRQDKSVALTGGGRPIERVDVVSGDPVLDKDAIARTDDQEEEVESGRTEGQRLLVITVLFFFHAVFWALFEQAGGSLTLFAERNIDRTVFGSEIPASLFQSFNPFYIMIFAPIFSWIWLRARKSGVEPSTPMKFVLGLAQLGLGFLVIVMGARFFASGDGLVPIVFLAIMYLLHTTGELSLSPVGLSMITKLSPGRIVGFVMGAWFLSISLGNNMAGLIGQLTATEGLAEDAPATVTLAVYSSTYLTWGVYVVLGAAALLLLLVPTLRRWMNGIH